MSHYNNFLIYIYLYLKIKFILNESNSTQLQLCMCTCTQLWLLHFKWTCKSSQRLQGTLHILVMYTHKLQKPAVSVLLLFPTLARGLPLCIHPTSSFPSLLFARPSTSTFNSIKLTINGCARTIILKSAKDISLKKKKQSYIY